MALRRCWTVAEERNRWTKLCRCLGSAYTLSRNEDTALDHPEHDKPSAATRRVEMADFRDDVAGYLHQVREGLSFVITADGAARAELRPVAGPETEAAPTRPSLIGAMAGQIWMADDFETWPEDILDAMEGKGE